MGNSIIRSYKDLIVWQKSFELSLLIYEITKDFPREEIYALTSQIRRAAVSVPSNIAEGYCRHRRLEYVQFLQIAFASSAEVETQLLIAQKLGYVKGHYFKEAISLLQEILKMLNTLIAKVKSSA